MARRVTLKMKLEFQTCRALRHSWDYFVPGVGQRRPAPWGRGFSLRCERCGTERHDTFDSLGALSARSYVYPDGYSLPADEQPTLEQLRMSIVAELRTEAAARADVVNNARRKPHREPARKRRHLQPATS